MSGQFAPGFTTRAWQQLRCVRVSRAGQLEIEFRRPGEEVEYWLSFNLRHRPGWALIVGDEVKHLGWAGSLQELEQAMNRRLVDRRSKPCP